MIIKRDCCRTIGGMISALIAGIRGPSNIIELKPGCFSHLRDLVIV